MCLIVLAHRVHDAYPLVAGANRDEFHARPTRPAGFWDDAAGTLAGRDLLAGGTWLGVTRTGRFAAVTNVREPGKDVADRPSRGSLVTGFLADSEPPERYARTVAGRATARKGFNLVVGASGDLWYLTNRAGPGRAIQASPVPRGVHGIANAALDSPWPKVTRGREQLRRALARDAVDPESIFELLADEAVAPDAELPDTGVGLELERALSPARVRLPGYGTRSSTVVLISSAGHVDFFERTWPSGNGMPETRRFRFRISDPVWA